MSKYFITQIKKLLRVLPAILLVAALLYSGLRVAYNSLILQWNQSDVFQKVNLGMVGTADDYYLDLGLNAVQTMDSSKFTVSFIAIADLQEAKKALERGEIDAYIYFPPEFMDNAKTGLITPLQFVSAAGNENVLSLVKEEMTTALDDVLLSSERASFGLYDAMRAYGQSHDISHSKRNELATFLATMMLNRHNLYEAREIGVANGQRLDDYMLCGIMTLFLFLLTLPFVGQLIQENTVMEKHLKSRGIGYISQVLCELAAYALMLLVLAAAMLALLSAFTLQNLLIMLPVVLSVAAISFLVYSLSRDIITGVLLQFVTVIALCFVSGCMYPVHFFPIVVQNFGTWLPPSWVRSCLSAILYGTDCSTAGWTLLGIAVCATAFSVFARWSRANGGRRARA